MAVTIYDSSGNVTSVSKVLKEHYEDKFIEALNTDTQMLKFFKTASGEGIDVELHAHYSGNTSTEWYDEDDSYGSAGQQGYETAKTPYKRVRINIKVSRFAAKASKGDGAYVDLMADELERGMTDLRHAVNNRLMEFSKGSDAGKVDCIGYIVSDGTPSGEASYAGIDRTSKTWWASTILKNGSGDFTALDDRPLTEGLLQKMKITLANKGLNIKTNYILSSWTHFYQYLNLFSDRVRWDGNLKDPDLDSDSARYAGITWVPVLGMDDGRVFFIQSSDWNYYLLEGFETEEVPSTTDADIYAIKQYAQLVCRSPQSQGAIVNLAA